MLKQARNSCNLKFIKSLCYIKRFAQRKIYKEKERLTKWTQTLRNEILKIIYQVFEQQYFANREKMVSVEILYKTTSLPNQKLALLCCKHFQFLSFNELCHIRLVSSVIKFFVLRGLEWFLVLKILKRLIYFSLKRVGK